MMDVKSEIKNVRNVLIVVIAALMLAGCQQEQGTIQDEKAEEKPKEVAQKEEKEKTQEKEDATLEIGEVAIFNGSKARVTVHSYTPNVQSSNQFADPGPGKEFALIDVTSCAGDEQASDINPFYFVLQMPNNTRIDPTFSSGLEPRLNRTKLAPGDCVRGNVVFEAPRGEKPSYVLFNPPIQRQGTQPRWTI